MDKTHFSNVCKVLAELWLAYNEEAKNHDEWREFFEWADIALPLAYMKNENLVTGIKDEGKKHIEEAWDVFCKMIAIDPNGSYDGIADAFNASPNGVAASE